MAGQGGPHSIKQNEINIFTASPAVLHSRNIYFITSLTLSSTDRTNLTNTSKPWSHMSLFDYVPKHPWISLLIYSGCILALGGCRSLYHQPPLRPCQRRNSRLLDIIMMLGGDLIKNGDDLQNKSRGIRDIYCSCFPLSFVLNIRYYIIRYVNSLAN